MTQGKRTNTIIVHICHLYLHYYIIVISDLLSMFLNLLAAMSATLLFTSIPSSWG